jgi:hypothetical protein
MSAMKGPLIILGGTVYCAWQLFFAQGVMV